MFLVMLLKQINFHTIFTSYNFIYKKELKTVTKSYFFNQMDNLKKRTSTYNYK